MINIFCGGTLHLETGQVTYPFNFNPERLIKITESYLIKENIVNKCDTFNPNFDNYEIVQENIKDYLKLFGKFTKNYTKRFPNFYPEIIDKKVCFEIFNDKNGEKVLLNYEINSNKFLTSEYCNKKFVIPSNLFNALYEKKIVFDNLYTGYEAEVYRYPIENYNRDIVIYFQMFGY